MDVKELSLEKQKLKEVITKLNEEEVELEDNLQNSSKGYSKDDFVRAHLLYLGHKKLHDIRNVKSKPYFARLDFTEEGEKEERLYIGKISVVDSKENIPIIVDWRAPISNLYYDGRIGEATYESPKGIVKGNISLKRQFFIEDGNLEKYTDIDLKTNDELLQVAISEKADDRLKNIVATIQAKQNAVIRADINKPLIVQGVAGSGKTTIALHRIAYLIYKYEQDFDPENFMIIAPTKFFLNYISNVLPDLGVENVRQYTFEDFAYEVLGKRLKISDSNEKLVTIVNKEFNDINNGDVDLIIKESKFKSSIKFKEFIDMYLEELEENFLPKNDFVLENIRIMRYENIQRLFKETYSNLPFVKRIDEIKKHIFSKIRNNYNTIDEGIRKQRSIKIRKLEKEGLDPEEERKRRIEIFEETEDVLKLLDKENIKIVDFYFKDMILKDAFLLYRDCIEKFIYSKIDDQKLAKYLVENTLENLYNKEIAFEDLAPIMYIHYKVYGVKWKKNLRHVIIDEAQDYGEFQFSTLKTILNSSSMTILGDIAQGVHFYRGIEDWDDFINIEFPEEGATYLELEKTYRTTKEIMEVANDVIVKLPEKERKGIVLGEPVIDTKESIRIEEKTSDEEIIKTINERIDKYLSDNFKSIAIIGKDMEECKMIKKLISKYRKDVNLIQSKDSEYKAGISIVPSYLAKGLEFDSVILYNVNEEKYTNTSLDIKLLYVAITRAMSKLDVFYIGNKSKLLSI